MRLAVVKPDHLGDLVLASAAVRAVAGAHPDLTLFVSSRSRALAGWLFPELEVYTLDLPHLAKADAEDAAPCDLSGYDAVAFLRRDGVMTPQWADLRTRRHAMFVEDHDTHQSLLDYGVVREFAPAYDIDAHFFPDSGASVAEKAQRSPRRVGLSIGSGFYTNAWPLLRWVELAKALARRGIEVWVVCGPAETGVARVLLDAAGLARDRLILGRADFAAFSAAVDELDLVVGSDGGTAHLCSLTTPVLSIFGVQSRAPLRPVRAREQGRHPDAELLALHPVRRPPGERVRQRGVHVGHHRRGHPGRHRPAGRSCRRAPRLGAPAPRPDVAERGEPLGAGGGDRCARAGGGGMADVTPAALQAALLRLQARRLAVISLVMSSRVEKGASPPPTSGLAVFGYRFRIVVAYLQLRLAIRACETLQRETAP